MERVKIRIATDLAGKIFPSYFQCDYLLQAFAIFTVICFILQGNSLRN